MAVCTAVDTFITGTMRQFIVLIPDASGNSFTLTLAFDTLRPSYLWLE